MATGAERMEHAETADLGRTLEGVGENIARYGLVAICYGSVP